MVKNALRILRLYEMNICYIALVCLFMKMSTKNYERSLRRLIRISETIKEVHNYFLLKIAIANQDIRIPHCICGSKCHTVV